MPDWLGAGAGSLFSGINPLPAGANVTYESVRNADLSTLSGAVDSLSALTAKLTELEQDAEAMNGMAHGSLWAGINATVSRAHIRRTARKFSHARTQAESLHSILQTLLADLQASQSALLQLEQSSEANGVRVSPDGTISSSEPPHLTLQQATTSSLFWNEENVPPETFHAMRDTSTLINQTIEEAAVSDRTAARALADIIDEGNGRFSATDLNTMEDAVRSQVQQDAATFADLAGKESRTPAEWRALGELTALHADDPLFAEYAIDTIGVENYLALAQELDISSADLTSANVDVDSIRTGMANTFNTAMSPSIDITTHPPGSEAYNHWIADEGQAYKRRLDALNALGSERMYEPTDPSWLDPVQDERIGYDIFLDLMESADEPMHDIFYYDMLDGMVAAEKNNPGVWMGDRYPETENGWDPKNNGTDRLFVLGSDKNVEATTRFFDPDHNENLEYFIGDSEDSRSLFYNIESFGDFWGGGTFNESPGLTSALETAATGRPSGGTPGTDYEGHSDANIRIAEYVWDSYADDPSRSLGDRTNPDMRPTLGIIAADYITDISFAVADMTNENPEAEFGHGTARLLAEVGKDVDAYRKITVANEFSMHASMDSAVRDHGGNESLLREAAANITNRSGQVSGLMTDAYATARYDEQIADDATHNASVDEMEATVSWFLGGAVYASIDNGGAASMTDTVVQDSASGIFSKYREDNSIEAEEQAQRDYEESRRAHLTSSRIALEESLSRAGIDTAEFDDYATMKSTMEREAGAGHDNGSHRITRKQ